MNTEDWSVKEIIQKRLTFYTEKWAPAQGKSVKRGGGKALIPAALRKSDKGESGKNQKICKNMHKIKEKCMMDEYLNIINGKLKGD